MKAFRTEFRYFQHPHDFANYVDELRSCDLCGQLRSGGYGGPFYGLHRIEWVCEECLTAGRLAEVDGTTNDGDIGTLQAQLRTLRPELTPQQIDALARSLTAELSQRTPSPITGQDFLWPAHCGDYCRFIKEVGKPDLNALAPDGDGESFFSQHLIDDEFSPNLWEDLRPDSPRNHREPCSMGAYLFQCLSCGAYLIRVDRD